MIRALPAVCFAALSFSVALPALAKAERCFSLDSMMNEKFDAKKAKLFEKLESEGYVQRDEWVARKEKQTFVGVGLVLDLDDDNRVNIASVLPGSPAARIGMFPAHAGQFGFRRILAVDGTQVPSGASVSEVRDMIRGNGRVGTGVVLTLESVHVGGGRSHDRYLERKRITATVEKPYVCFDKKKPADKK